MNGYVLIPIILGSVLLVGGAVVAGVAVANGVANSKMVTNTYELTDEQTFNNIKVNLSISDCEFRVAEGDKCTVVCEETEKYYHTVKVEDNTLVIDNVMNRKWYEWFNFNWKKKKVTVYLPNTTYGNLKIDSSTGDVIIPKEFSFANTNIYMSTGDIEFAANVTTKCEIHSTTGRIYINGITTDELKVSASTGYVETNKVTANSLDIRTTTGDVYVNETVIAGNMKIKCSTGDVKFYKSDADTIKVETSTGDVTGSLLSNKVFDAHSSTGRVNVPHTTTGGTCEVKTSTGRIELSIVE